MYFFSNKHDGILARGSVSFLSKFCCRVSQFYLWSCINRVPLPFRVSVLSAAYIGNVIYEGFMKLLISPYTLHQILSRGLSQIVQRDMGADFEDVACLSISKNMVAAAMVVWFTGSLAHLETPMLTCCWEEKNFGHRPCRGGQAAVEECSLKN